MQALLASASKDTSVKLWDAKSGGVVATLHGHKSMVNCAVWHPNGQWLLSAGKDSAIKVFDIRMLAEVNTFRGHERDVNAVAWHPFHEDCFVSGGADGALMFWGVAAGPLTATGGGGPVVALAPAHEGAVLALAWHPMGQTLCRPVRFLPCAGRQFCGSHYFVNDNRLSPTHSGGTDNCSKLWGRSRLAEQS